MILIRAIPPRLAQLLHLLPLVRSQALDRLPALDRVHRDAKTTALPAWPDLQEVSDLLDCFYLFEESAKVDFVVEGVQDVRAVLTAVADVLDLDGV